MPVEILDVSGIDNITKNAGKDSSISSHFIFLTTPIIRLPTIINAGEVIAATPDKDPTSGPKNEAMMNSTATVNAVKPVRPPTATPDPDSRYAVDGLVPNIAPAVVASESETSALRARGSFPSFNNPACFDTPINVPVVSNNVTKMNEKITPYRPYSITSEIAVIGLNTINPSGKCGSATTLSIESCPVNIAMIAVTIIPIKIAPFTLRAINATVINSPIKVSNGAG